MNHIKKTIKVLFYFGHPAQYLFLRRTIQLLLESNNRVVIVIKTKDVLESLLKNDKIDYINILPNGRGKSKFSILLSLFKRNIKLIPVILKFKPHLMIGTDASIAQLGWLFRINRITITEDDFEVIRSLGRLTYPFTNTILCPTVCDVNSWEKKKIGYLGYMKLAYLHPNVFIADTSILRKYKISEKFVLIRLAKLTAHHDFGVKGIDHEILDKLIKRVSEEKYKVFISSEGDIPEKYSAYILKIIPNDLHNILASASLLVSDSQSMSVEAAMLGVPSIRLSDFAGRISVLEELEFKYQLTFGIKPTNENLISERLEELLRNSNLKQEFQNRRQIMLNEKIDVSAFLFWLIQNYPKSLAIANDQTFQRTFK